MSEYRKKLIEVALPLDEINAACKADKDRKTGTIRNLHKWFAPMPLPAWRALLYAALIDNPEEDEKRAYHLDVIKRLVANGADLPDADTLDEARYNIERQFPSGLPGVMDPFCGGGSTLVEAQRLGLATVASDLNPVPVLISRVLTQLLPEVRYGRPMHPEVETSESSQHRRVESASTPEQGALEFNDDLFETNDPFSGLKEDVTYYAKCVSERVWERVSPHYPSDVGEVPIAWLWARTALCPNPACGVETVLTTSWWLSKKTGDRAWLVPSCSEGQVHLQVIAHQSQGQAPESPKSTRGALFQCVACGAPITDGDLSKQAEGPGLGLRMTAVVGDRKGERDYRPPTSRDTEAVKVNLSDAEVPDLIPVSDGGTRKRFGLDTQADLYTPRQLLTLSAFADEVAGVRAEILEDGGTPVWADTVVSLLALAVGNMSMAMSTQARWRQRESAHAKAEPAFGRNDLPMMWDFAETFPWGNSVGDWMLNVRGTLRALKYVPSTEVDHPSMPSRATRADARTTRLESPGLVATDPPYFDAIGYADLSDYFYVWHRRALRDVHADLYQTLAAPKQGELTALPSHHGNSREAARQYFIDGFTEVFANLQESAREDLPMLVVYASREQKSGGGDQTRWSSILTAIVNSGLEITGAWPIHGTGSTRMIGQGANAVATYVAMVTRPRPPQATAISVQEFNRSLRQELKVAVRDLQAAGILPVDLAQAALGPGMQVYSRHKAVLDQSGKAVPVEQALRLINQALAEVLDEQEGELDPDSRFSVTWWEKHHWDEAAFGEADQLARPHGISVDDVVRAGVAVYSRPGFVRVVGDRDLNRGWDPSHDSRPTSWEAVHHLADRLIDGGGITEAGALMGKLGVLRDQAQGLVYRLHAIAARKGWTKDQERYNSLIGSWSDLLAESGRSHGEMDGLF